MTTFILFLWLIPIAVNVYVDREGHKPNYMIVFIIRGMAAILHGIILDVCCDYFPENLWQFSVLELIGIYAPIFLFQATSFWIFFELALNSILRREPFYFDRKERDSGWIDKIFDSLGTGAHLTAKVCAFIVMILSIITIYSHT